MADKELSIYGAPIFESDPIFPETEFRDHWVKIYPELRTYVIALLQDVSDAEEVLQLISQEAINGFSSYEPSESFQDWLFGIARISVRRFYLQQNPRS